MPFVSFDLEVKILTGGFRAAYGPSATTEVLALLMQAREPGEARVLDAVLDAFSVMTSMPAAPCIRDLEPIDSRGRTGDLIVPA